MSKFGIVQNCLPLKCNGVGVDVKSLSLLDRPSGPVAPSVCKCVSPSSVAVQQRSSFEQKSSWIWPGDKLFVTVCGRGACYPLLSAIRGALLRLRQVAPVVGRRAVQRRRWKKPECSPRTVHPTTASVHPLPPHRGLCCGATWLLPKPVRQSRETQLVCGENTQLPVSP